MSEYKNEDYSPIYVKCLRPDQSTPFDCYVLLRQSNRIVLWLRQGLALPKAKHTKLVGHSVDKIFIRIEDKKAYFSYLDNFLSSTDGRESLKEIQNHQDLVPIEGLPHKDEYSLKALMEDSTAEIDATQIEGKIEAENKIAVPGSAAVNGNFGKIEVGEQIAGPLGDVIRAIKSEVSDFERMAVRGLVKELEDRKVIEDCTLKINEEFVRIESKLKKENLIDPSQVENIKRRYDEQIIFIRGKIDQDDKAVINRTAQAIATAIDELQFQSKSKSINPRDLRKRIKAIKNQIVSLGRLAKDDPHTIVSKTVSHMIGSVEQKLGQRLTLDPHVGLYEETPEYITQKLNLDDIMGATSDEVKRFQHQIIKQNILIQDMDRRYQKNRHALKSLKDKWYVFHVQAKKNFSGGDILTAKEIDKTFQQFECDLGGLQSDSNTLLNLAHKLTNDMGGKHIAIDPQLLAEIGALSQEDQEKLKKRVQEKDFDSSGDQHSKSLSSTGLETPTLDEVPLGKLLNLTEQADEKNLGVSAEDSGEIDHLKSENEILKTQLENSQKLVEASSLKIEELAKLNEKNNELTEMLEDQNAEYGRLNARLEEKVEKFQSSEDIYHDTLDDANDLAKLNQAQVDAQKETVAELRNQLDFYSKENECLKGTVKLDKIMRDKEEHLEKIKKTLEFKQEEVQELKKEIVNLTGKLSGSLQKFKHFSHKVDRMTAEVEALKKANRASLTKAEGSTNALKQMRTTVSKLTAISDQLRKDRQFYILKTNEALAKFKSMTSEASNLNRQAEAGGKIRTDLENKLKSARETEEQLRVEINQLKTEVRSLQMFIKSQRKEAS